MLDAHGAKHRPSGAQFGVSAGQARAGQAPKHEPVFASQFGAAGSMQSEWVEQGPKHRPLGASQFGVLGGQSPPEAQAPERSGQSSGPTQDGGASGGSASGPEPTIDPESTSGPESTSDPASGAKSTPRVTSPEPHAGAPMNPAAATQMAAVVRLTLFGPPIATRRLVYQGYSDRCDDTRSRRGSVQRADACTSAQDRIVAAHSNRGVPRRKRWFQTIRLILRMARRLLSHLALFFFLREE